MWIVTITSAFLVPYPILPGQVSSMVGKTSALAVNGTNASIMLTAKPPTS
jgi:hypothetical protein